MTYRIVAHPGVQKEIEKLFKKDKVRYEYIKKRLKILAEQPEIGKPLRNVLKGKRRVQIGSFVLIKYMDEDIIIQKAIRVLVEELGPIDAIRFITIPKIKKLESVKRHRDWQMMLDKDRIFDEVFAEKS